MEVTCTSSNRDMILRVLARETCAEAEYRGAPSFTVSVGGYSLLRDGRITADADPRGVFPTLALLGLCDFPWEPDPPQPGLIAYPMACHSGRTLLNLLSILSARQRLLNQALAARDAFCIAPELMDCLLAHPPVTRAEFLQALYGRQGDYQGVSFSRAYVVLSGFQKGKPGEASIHRQLADRIMDAALSQAWVKPFTRNVRNKKYAFRTWLNAIGMTGPEYGEARRVLLGRLPGKTDRRRLPPRKEG